METGFQINKVPTQFDLEKIEEWLIEEERESNEGFHCSWLEIERAFKEFSLITLNEKGSPIGFCIWSKGEISVNIDLFEIKPKFRRKGIGKLFVEKISDYFKDKGFLAIVLYCSPRESEHFWTAIGFIQFPKFRGLYSDLTFFKPLILWSIV
jgi:GNAT superfamily N-acetyltransferase